MTGFVELNRNDEAVSFSDFVNVRDVEGISHLKLIDTAARIITADNLEYVNLHSGAVCPRESFYTKYGKRAIDIFASIFALALTFPVNLALAICTFFDVGSPIMFHQSRVGYKNQTFTICKFRNMTNATDENGELLPAKDRVTKLGKFVRKTSLDELLNFWSILKGDMSLIGPRPLLLDYVDVYSERHKARHAVRPGLECPMLNKAYNRDSWTEQFENDIFYVENVSLMLDFKMALALVRMVFDRKGTSQRGNAEKGSFMGYRRDGSSIDSSALPVRYYLAALEQLGYEATENINVVVKQSDNPDEKSDLAGKILATI